MLKHGNKVKHLYVAPEFTNNFEALFPLSRVFSVDFLGWDNSIVGDQDLSAIGVDHLLDLPLPDPLSLIKSIDLPSIQKKTLLFDFFSLPDSNLFDTILRLTTDLRDLVFAGVPIKMMYLTSPLPSSLLISLSRLQRRNYGGFAAKVGISYLSDAKALKPSLVLDDSCAHEPDLALSLVGWAPSFNDDSDSDDESVDSQEA
nr:hypothetical protein [Tanacetum cinerariifolium]